MIFVPGAMNPSALSTFGMPEIFGTGFPSSPDSSAAWSTSTVVVEADFILVVVVGSKFPSAVV